MSDPEYFLQFFRRSFSWNKIKKQIMSGLVIHRAIKNFESLILQLCRRELGEKLLNLGTSDL
jgi:hypothetical protein